LSSAENSQTTVEEDHRSCNKALISSSRPRPWMARPKAKAVDFKTKAKVKHFGLEA